HPYDRLRAVALGVVDQQVIGRLARLLAELGVDRDVAAEQRLQPAEHVADDRARAHADPAHDADVAHDLVARQLERRRDHIVVHRLSSFGSKYYRSRARSISRSTMTSCRSCGRSAACFERRMSSRLAACTSTPNTVNATAEPTR